MKLFKNILSRKPDAEEIAAMEAELSRGNDDAQPRRATTDDSGAKNASLKGAGDLYPALEASEPAPDEEVDGWSANAWSDDDDDEDWDDEDWGEAWDTPADAPEVRTGAPEDRADEAKAALVEGLRDAARDIQSDGRRDGIRNWSEDEEFAQADEERILSRTNSEMTNVLSSRRRSALAHLKKAAQATKADRVLSHVVSRDGTGDAEEQSPYRDDLAKVVKPRATSRPVSRPVSRSPKVAAEWEGKPADDDAAMMADAARAAPDSEATKRRLEAEADRQQHLPTDLSEDEFTSDEVLVVTTQGARERIADGIDDEFEDEDDMPRGPASWSKPVFENGDDEDDAAVALATRRASRVRTALIEPVEEEVEDETPDPLAEAEAPANWGLGGMAAAQDDAEEIAFDDDDFDDDGQDDGDDWSAPSLDATPEAAPRIQPIPEQTVTQEAGDSHAIDLDALRNSVSRMKTEEAAAAHQAPDAATEAAPEVTAAPQAAPEPEPEAIVQVPTPAVGRAGRSAGRVKTRLLGFQAAEAEPDVFDKASSPEAGGRSQFPVGWIVVVDGPGRGAAFTLMGGVMQIGRGAGQGVQLDFGDTAISRENHAAVAFDDETGKFFLGHGGKSNLVRLNGAPVLATEEMKNRDRIRIGETTLMLISLCDEQFTWTSGESDNG